MGGYRQRSAVEQFQELQLLIVTSSTFGVCRGEGLFAGRAMVQLDHVVSK